MSNETSGTKKRRIMISENKDEEAINDLEKNEYK
jgi:hypothetical protein